MANKIKKKRTIGETIVEEVEEYKSLYYSLKESYEKEQPRPVYLKERANIKKLTLMDLSMRQFIADKVYEEVAKFIEEQEKEVSI